MQTDSSSTLRRIKRRLNIKTKRLTIQDEAILTHANNLRKQLKGKTTLIDIPFINSPENISLVFYAFEKQVSNLEFSLFLSHFLSSLKPLMNILRQSNSKETLMMLSHKLIFEKHEMNHLLFRYGNFADKFYIVLKGTVSVIIYKELEVKMTYEDYISHLKRLKHIKEDSLVKTIIKINSHIIKESNVNYILSSDESEEERNIARQTSLNAHKSRTNNSYNINSNQIEIISPNLYIQRALPQTQPINSDNSNKIGYDITLLIYFNLLSLGIGKTFGDIALANPNCLRTGTIICNEDCYLGSLTKASYDSLVKDSQDKLRKSKILTILSSPIFTGIRVDTFIKKYFNCFKEQELDQGAVLFSQGDEREEIFLIKEGEIDITTRLSFNELTSIIKDKDGVIDQFKDKKLFYDLLIYDIPIKFKKKREYKLFVLKDGEVAGLDDCLFNNKYLCNAICSSMKSTIYSIQYSMFQRIVEDEECIKNNLPSFVEVKIEVLRKRLIVLRNREISNQVKLLPSLSNSNILKPLNNSNSNSNSDRIFLNQMIQTGHMTKMKMKDCFTTRNKPEVFNLNNYTSIYIKQINEQPNKMKTILDYKNKKRVLFNIEDKKHYNERMMNYSSALKNEYDRNLSQGNNEYKFGINPDSFTPLADNYYFKSQIQSDFQFNTNKKKNSSFRNKSKKTLAISSSCTVLNTYDKISNKIIDQILSISSRNQSRSKGLILQRTDITQEEKKLTASYNHNPGVIDFLALDKVYESSETKKIKKPKPKVTMIPLNILLLKKSRYSSLNGKRSSNER